MVLGVVLTMPLNASAASVGTQDGLEVSILTDKDTYTADEEILVSVSIKNTNTYEVKGISIETILPEGLDGEEVELKYQYNADRTQVKVTGKLILGNPTVLDTDGDGFIDGDDNEPMEYTITDRTLAIIESLSYVNLLDYVDIGATIGDAIDNGAKFSGMTEENMKLVKDAIIIYSNHSGIGWSGDFADRGLGSIAVKFSRNAKNDAIIYALRGTEPDADLANDAITDLVLGLGWDSAQSKVAFNEYVCVANSKNNDYYITGHSLGGRLVQDVIYKIYNANEGFLGMFNKKDIPVPVHSATFNALGYNKLVYATLENDILGKYVDKLTNFYYVLDLVGEGLGNSAVFLRAGKQVELLPKDISGSPYRTYPTEGLNMRDSDYHGIKYFVNDYSLLPTSHHNFDYWKE